MPGKATIIKLVPSYFMPVFLQIVNKNCDTRAGQPAEYK
jgi:hypothetical protein